MYMYLHLYFNVIGNAVYSIHKYLFQDNLQTLSNIALKPFFVKLKNRHHEPPLKNAKVKPEAIYKSMQLGHTSYNNVLMLFFNNQNIVLNGFELLN